MLYLYRYPNQTVKLTIGDVEISVVNLGVRGRCVKLGFDAPHSVKINREDNNSNHNDIESIGQQLTPEQQEREAIKRIKNGVI
jgi:sRNA-binding carbon storage regulator CsrA